MLKKLPLEKKAHTCKLWAVWLCGSASNDYMLPTVTKLAGFLSWRKNTLNFTFSNQCSVQFTFYCFVAVLLCQNAGMHWKKGCGHRMKQLHSYSIVLISSAQVSLTGLHDWQPWEFRHRTAQWLTAAWHSNSIPSKEYCHCGNWYLQWEGEKALKFQN